MDFILYEDQVCIIKLLLLGNKMGLYLLKSKNTGFIIRTLVGEVADLPYLSDNPF